MKLLMIKNSRGFFFNPIHPYKTENDGYVDIEKINKDDLLDIVNYSIDNDIEIDHFTIGSISNPVQETVYKELDNKLSQLVKNKSDLSKEIESMFLEAENKYKIKEK